MVLLNSDYDIFLVLKLVDKLFNVIFVVIEKFGVDHLEEFLKANELVFGCVQNVKEVVYFGIFRFRLYDLNQF